jgi:putative spermidine/putrescine transport system substrate-binding protein
MNGRKARVVRWAAFGLLVTALSVVAAGCGGGDDGGSASTEIEGLGTTVEEIQANGQTEGAVSLVAWPYYVEDGSNDPAADWVTGFEEESGCDVTVKVANSSDEMVTLMKTGQYDAISASGNASLRLVAGGDVVPVNTDFLTNWDDIFPDLKDQPYNTVDGVPYGVPHGRGANLLMWRTDIVKPAPTSWGAVFDANSPYKGKVTAYDDSVYIADAAVYLMATQPDLEITNPYELDDTQFQAAVDLLKTQKTLVGEYWVDAAKTQASFTSGDSVIGTTWQVIANLAQAEKVPVDVTLPEEGATGWSDTWMISSSAEHPNCAYLWLNHISSPEANAAVAEYFGEAPANEKACDLTENEDHCETFHAGDAAYWENVYYWITPLADCGDDRGEVCKDHSEWVQAWTEIRGS